jgi:hypothetical protein
VDIDEKIKRERNRFFIVVFVDCKIKTKSSALAELFNIITTETDS